jgi:hypothetical protein
MMAHEINMRRLHMGCGESLRSELPLVFNLKGRVTPTGLRGNHPMASVKGHIKNQRNESH